MIRVITVQYLAAIMLLVLILMCAETAIKCNPMITFKPVIGRPLIIIVTISYYIVQLIIIETAAPSGDCFGIISCVKFWEGPFLFR